ncbi:MAG: ribosome small subunit-dependent GTPase A [Bacteroidales bacterium]|nr:ribosome small subunit-dependent GTPase A [Bacteroidales bacterium]
MEKMKTGTAVVVKHTGSHYMLSKLPEWDLFPAVIKGKLRLKGSTSTNPIAVGDIVEYDAAGANGPATIKGIVPRRNCIVRKSTNLSRQSHVIAANIDMAFLIATVDFPQVKLQFIDRFLVTCEAYNVPVTILLNKMDLYEEHSMQMVEAFKAIYSGAGYDIIETSVESGLGIDMVKEACKDKVVLFSGQSGVGKSSIISALDPNLNLKIGEISAYHLQGKHTTTFYEMHKLESGGFVVDTPGIRGFGLVDVKPEELSTYFPEMLRIEDNCRFVPCTHTHEPGCAVKDGVEAGIISVERYESYLGMLDEEGKYR